MPRNSAPSAEEDLAGGVLGRCHRSRSAEGLNEQVVASPQPIEESQLIEESIFGPAASQLLSLIGDAVVSTDRAGNIVLFNKVAEEMFRFEAGEVIGRPVEILMPARLRELHHRDVMDFASISSAVQRPMGHRREVTGRRKDGVEFPVEASLSRHIVDGQAFLTAVLRDISDRKQLDEERALLASEVAHRLKNMMAVVNSIVSLTARGASSVGAFEEALRGRLNALARTQEILLQDGARAADLRQLLESELSPYRSYRTGNVVLTGPSVTLPSRTATSLGLAIHELVTNAAKYGALSMPLGIVSIDWRVEEQLDRQALVLNWSETSGPPILMAVRRGFGTSMIERVIGAGARLDFQPAGLHARIELAIGNRN